MMLSDSPALKFAETLLFCVLEIVQVEVDI